MIEEKALKRMYLEEHKRVREIAKHLDVSEFKVMYWMKKYGIRKVERWERYGLKKFSKRQKEYLYGSLLGDDSLVMSEDKKYPYLQVGHSNKQKKYVKWKYKIWRKIVPGGIKNITVKNKYETARFHTAVHPDFLEFWNLFYPNGRKIVNRRILDNCTPFSIAVWYMDDGYFKESRCRARLSTNSFSYDENCIIKEYFKEKWNINSNLGTSDSGTHYIWFNTKNTIRFFEIVEEHLIPFFDYKIDSERELQWKALSEEELKYIEENYGIESPRLIAEKLDRPLRTIFSVAWRLGVTESRGGRKEYEKTLERN